MGGVRAGAGLVREGGREGGVRGSTRRMATVGHGGGTVRGDRPTTPPCGGGAAVSTGRLCVNGRPQEPRCTNKSPQCSTLATRGCPSACSGPGRRAHPLPPHPGAPHAACAGRRAHRLNNARPSPTQPTRRPTGRPPPPTPHRPPPTAPRRPQPPTASPSPPPAAAPVTLRTRG